MGCHPRADGADARQSRLGPGDAPVIEKYLDSPAGGNQGGGMLAVSFPKLKSRTFCTAAILEIRRDGARWRVGMETDCGEYARRGNTLVAGTEAGADEVMVLARAADGQYRVVAAVSDNYPVVPDYGWVDRHFSPGAAYELNYGTWPAGSEPGRAGQAGLRVPAGHSGREPLAIWPHDVSKAAPPTRSAQLTIDPKILD
jgi:hypothetical protein